MDSPEPSYFDLEQASSNFKNLQNPAQARSCLESLFARPDQFDEFLAFDAQNIDNVASAILLVHHSDPKPLVGAVEFFSYFLSPKQGELQIAQTANVIEAWSVVMSIQSTLPAGQGRAAPVYGVNPAAPVQRTSPQPERSRDVQAPARNL